MWGWVLVYKEDVQGDGGVRATWEGQSTLSSKGLPEEVNFKLPRIGMALVCPKN